MGHDLLVLHLVCLSKVFQRSCFLFESGCKGKADFSNIQIFSKIFSEKFFSASPLYVNNNGNSSRGFRAYPFSLPCLHAR